MRYLTILLIVVLVPAGHAQDVSFVRDYNYKANDLDSKISARNNTLNLIKADVVAVKSARRSWLTPILQKALKKKTTARPGVVFIDGCQRNQS